MVRLILLVWILVVWSLGVVWDLEFGIWNLPSDQSSWFRLGLFMGVRLRIEPEDATGGARVDCAFAGGLAGDNLVNDRVLGATGAPPVLVRGVGLVVRRQAKDFFGNVLANKDFAHP